MYSKDQAVGRPRSGRIKHALAHFGLSRTRLYEYAAEHAGLFKKDGRSVIVDFDILDRIITDLPPAKIKTPKKPPLRDFSEIKKARASP
jgi:hypothetical protein